MILETERLMLRQWKEEDREPFASLNNDKETMSFFPSTYSREVSDMLIDRETERIKKNDIGLLAVEVKATGEFLGFIGLARPSYETHFTPCTEIGWRLNRQSWRQGYATEGALEVIRFAFEELGLQEVVSFTSKLNLASIRVMEKIGMNRDLSGDFDHPFLDEGHKLRRHVLYRIKNNTLPI